MKLVYRGTAPGVRSSFSFTVSGCVHSGLLAWVILAGQAHPKAQSIYDQEIRPNEKKIVWYNLREKLPEVSPAETQADARPARARVKAPQTMVAGARDDASPAPLIWAPEPEATVPKAMPLPNVVAVAPPKIVRPFVAPPEADRSLTVAAPMELPDAPKAAVKVTEAKMEMVKPSGPLRAFVAPAETNRSLTVAAPILPDAPKVAVRVTEAKMEMVKPSGPLRAFVAPAEVRMQRQALLTLPESPVAEVGDAGALPGAGLEKVPRAYVSRKGPAMPGAAASISAEPPVAPPIPGATAAATLAIVGLNPANTMEVPAPPRSRAAGFSAGAETRAEGGTGANGMALLNVPGLMVKGGAKDTQPTLMTSFSPTSRENLLAAARVAKGSMPDLPAETRTSRVVAPDPRFAGRRVYTMAVQMPNVTSFSGSWLVWFAEREPQRGGAASKVRPPEVVRKVDPKYIAAAAAERVEGIVRLFGVIGKDGRVGLISMVHQLDARLDRSAQEALAKWEFSPALRDGVAVDVDAIFEIPFHLAPRLNQ